MLFVKFEAMALLGLLTCIGISLIKFNKSTPSLGTFWGNILVLKAYLILNFWPIVVNILIMISFGVIISTDINHWFTKLFTGGAISGEEPAQFFFIAWLVGLAAQKILSNTISKVPVLDSKDLADTVGPEVIKQ
jgi:hypothetical protein